MKGNSTISRNFHVFPPYPITKNHFPPQFLSPMHSILPWAYASRRVRLGVQSVVRDGVSYYLLLPVFDSFQEHPHLDDPCQRRIVSTVRCPLCVSARWFRFDQCEKLLLHIFESHPQASAQDLKDVASEWRITVIAGGAPASSEPPIFDPLTQGFRPLLNHLQSEHHTKNPWSLWTTEQLHARRLKRAADSPQHVICDVCQCVVEHCGGSEPRYNVHGGNTGTHCKHIFLMAGSLDLEIDGPTLGSWFAVVSTNQGKILFRSWIQTNLKQHKSLERICRTQLLKFFRRYCTEPGKVVMTVTASPSSPQPCLHEDLDLDFDSDFVEKELKFPCPPDSNRRCIRLSCLVSFLQLFPLEKVQILGWLALVAFGAIERHFGGDHKEQDAIRSLLIRLGQKVIPLLSADCKTRAPMTWTVLECVSLPLKEFSSTATPMDGILESFSHGRMRPHSEEKTLTKKQ